MTKKEERRTIGQMLEEAIEQLKTEDKINHVIATNNIVLELTMISGFDPEPITAVALYRSVVLDSLKKRDEVGIVNDIKNKVLSFIKGFVIRSMVAKCQKKEYGSGDHLIKEILFIISKAT